MRNAKDRLQKTALRLFSERGFSAVTTKEIAKEAETTEVTLFRHFPNKQALYDSLFTRFWQPPTLQYMDPMSFTGQWHTDMRRFTGIIHQSFQENCLVLRMLWKDGKEDPLKPWKQFLKTIEALLHSYLQQHWSSKGKKAAEEIAQSFMTSLCGIAINDCILDFLPDTKVGFHKESDILISAFYHELSAREDVKLYH